MKGNSKGQDQNSEARHSRRAGEGKPPEEGNPIPSLPGDPRHRRPSKPHEEHHHNRTPHQGRHGCRWRLAVAAAAHQTTPHRSPPPHLFPKTASSRRLRRLGRRRRPTKFGFSPGKQGGMGWGGQDLTDASKEVSGAHGRRRCQPRTHEAGISPNPRPRIPMSTGVSQTGQPPQWEESAHLVAPPPHEPNQEQGTTALPRSILPPPHHLHRAHRTQPHPSRPPACLSYVGEVSHRHPSRHRP